MAETPSPYQQRRTGKRPTYTKDVARERTLERNRRNTEAQRRAKLVLAERHPEEYADLYAAERAALDAERGPLPGDDPDAPDREG